MILVVVGLHSQGFERLVKKMDEIAAMINDEVVIQLGHTKYTPKYAKNFHFTDNKGIEELYKKADIVVTHGGAGSIMKALMYKKQVIAVPRLSKYGEHKNDHQLDIVNFFSKSGLLTAVYNINELEKNIRLNKSDTAKRKPYYSYESKKRRLMNFLKLYLHNLEKERHRARKMANTPLGE